jgi:D-arginine dehydrogenase
MTDVDVVVIGAGIAGASAGYELARDHSVLLLEQETVPGYHTTGRSAAVFTEAYERGAVQALARGSRPFLDEPPDVFAGAPLLNPMPVVVIARDDQRKAFKRFVEESPDDVLDVLEGEELGEFCHVLRDDIVVGAVERDAMEIDVHALHQGYLAGVRLRNGEVRTDAKVTALQWAGDRWRIAAGDSILSASVVVDAAGAWGDEVAALAGVEPLGIIPYRRTAFTFAPPDDTDITGWPMIIDVDEEFYVKPERNQFMGSLAEETPMEPHDVGVEEIDVALAIERIQAATTLEIVYVRRTWAGLRTFTPDRVPAIGFDPDHRGFFWLVGQGGFGIMTAPAAARTTAALVAGHRLPDDVAAAGLRVSDVDPARFR